MAVMKLGTAFDLVRRQSQNPGEPLRVHLVCSFTPLHLTTFAHAQLGQRAVDRNVTIESGPYLDIVRGLQAVESDAPEHAFVILEWPDLDPRLGLRRLDRWDPQVLPEILASVASRLGAIERALAGAARRTAIALCLPTLPLVPISHVASHHDDEFALTLRAHLAGFARRVAGLAGVRCLSQQHLDHASPPGQRHDVSMDLRAGFPYTREHAAVLADLLVELAVPAPRKKGLITDLDGTVWRGLLGEVGPAGVSWDLDHRSQIHGLYQQLLAALGKTGVLLAVATKNDFDLVSRALARDDALVSAGTFFPIEASWGAKSEAVTRILAAWDLPADSVVFIDDSPMELAEVRQVHPGIQCLRFPEGDPQAFYALMVELRDLFGTPVLAEDDALALDSVRSADAIRRQTQGGGEIAEAFLAEMQSLITLERCTDPGDEGPLELVNTLKQFNLNGRRFSESSWADYLARREDHVLLVSYRDKFGSLGKIGVLGFHVADQGEGNGQRVLCIDMWVMSTRAFSRRIEHRCLERLFQQHDVDAIAFDFVPTERNGPFERFLASLVGDGATGASPTIGREQFFAALPPLYSTVEERMHG